MREETTRNNLMLWFAAAAGFLYCFERLWGNAGRPICAAIGLVSLACLLCCVCSGSVLRRSDTWLIAAFLAMTCLSAFASYGITLRYFTSSFFCVWLFLIGLYFLMRTTTQPEALLHRFTVLTVAGSAIVNLYVLICATASLFTQIPGGDVLNGCFFEGRLCGISNANVLAFSAAALLLLSIFGCLSSRVRWPYVLAAVLGWFVMGLTNCRTTIIGSSAAIGLFVLCVAWRRKQSVGGFFAALCTGIAVGLLASLSFYLPLYLYRGVLHMVADITNNQSLEKNLATISMRLLTEDNGTLTSRTLIWEKVFRDIFSSPRRALLGLSSISDQKILDIVPSKPEFQASHAHNTYLEVLRRFGIPGFLLCMGLVVAWSVHGVKKLFNPKQKLSAVFLMAAAAGILLMGMTEQVPFPYSKACSLAPVFFLICGYSMRTDEE